MLLSITLTIRTDEQTRDQLDRIAAALNRNRNWVINDALENYIELHRWQLEHIEKGVVAAEAGRMLSTEEVRARLEQHMAGREAAQRRS